MKDRKRERVWKSKEVNNGNFVKKGYEGQRKEWQYQRKEPVVHTAKKYDAINEAEVLEDNIEDVLEGTSSSANLSAEEVPGMDTTVLN